MSLWYYAAALQDGPGPVATTNLDPAAISIWEQGIRDAIAIQGPRAVSDWQDFRDTGVWSGASMGSSVTMYDGVRAFLQAYFYFGCQDADYLTYAHAVANIQWRWLECGLNNPTCGSFNNFYRPNSILFYPDGLTSLYKLDPTFNGGPADPNLWNSGQGKTIPQALELLVNNCQFGEQQWPNESFNTSREGASREVAVTVMYYLDSLRVGNTLPASGRFDFLVQRMKDHMRQWLSDGPTLLGISPQEYTATYNVNNIPGSDDPALKNLAPWFMNITAEALIRTYREHPSYQNDSELISWIPKLGDWMASYMHEPEYAGTYIDRYCDCRDCNDPLVEGSPFSQFCDDNFSQRGSCWHIQTPWSQNPANLGDKQYQITTPMCWPSITYLWETTQHPQWAFELDSIFNVMTISHPIASNLQFGPGKQLNQMSRFFYDVVRVRNDPSIYTTFDNGALPCT